MKQIDHFIRLSRFESLTLHEVCKNIKVCVSFALDVLLANLTGYFSSLACASELSM